MKCFICGFTLTMYAKNISIRYNVIMLCCNCIRFLSSPIECVNTPTTTTLEECNSCIAVACNFHQRAKKMLKIGLDKIPLHRLLQTDIDTKRLELTTLFFESFFNFIHLLGKK